MIRPEVSFLGVTVSPVGGRKHGVAAETAGQAGSREASRIYN
jgi:hypothetical protein